MAARFARALGVPFDASSATPPPPPGTPRRLLSRMELIGRLPRRQQAALLTTIDAFLKSAGRAG